MKKYSSFIFIFVTIGIVLLSFILLKKSYKLNDEDELIDTSETSNVSVIDSKLGEDIKITEEYLYRYTFYKSSIWYKSKAYVIDYKINKKTIIYSLGNSMKDKKIIKATIEKKNIIKKGEMVYFVGTIDFENGQLILAKISQDDIEYQDISEIEFNNLYDNINKVLKNIFIINGYLVTDGNKYKLYDDKNAYKKDPDDKYFIVNWEEKFNYTGNQDVTIICNIGGTNILKHCKIKA